jgi:hypothetical protein
MSRKRVESTQKKKNPVFQPIILVSVRMIEAVHCRFSGKHMYVNSIIVIRTIVRCDQNPCAADGKIVSPSFYNM